MSRYSNYRDCDYYRLSGYDTEKRMDLVMPFLDKDRFHSHEKLDDDSYISKIKIEEDDKKIVLLCVDKDDKKLSRKLFHKKKDTANQTTPSEQMVEVEN